MPKNIPYKEFGTMMALIGVTDRYNMACPICYSGAGQGTKEVPPEKLLIYLEQLPDITETPILLRISGGEPSLRDDLPQNRALAERIGYGNIELVTNGIMDVVRAINFQSAARFTGWLY